jgi:hypothetical protein
LLRQIDQGNLVMRSAQNPRRDARFNLHRAHFLQHVDPTNVYGLEIGAFDLPLVEPHEGRCVFADWNTSDYLKDLARRQAGHNPDFVVPIQYNLKDGYDQIGSEHDWLGACHVIEHVPDVIGWLNQLESKLKIGGVFFLVIPDKRYFYDLFRSESTFTDALVAFRASQARPSFSQVFDHFYYSAPGVVAHEVWAGNAVPGPTLNFTGALALGEKAESEYVDAHCWVFTPQGFSSLIRSIIDARMTGFDLVDLRPTAAGQLDFSVVLRKTGKGRQPIPGAKLVSEH